MRDSKRSPTTEKMPSVTPKSSANSGFILIAPNAAIKNHTSIDPRRPPKKPSQLLLGEILGASLCLPNFDPNKYANESLAHTESMTASVIQGIEKLGSVDLRSTTVESESDVYSGPKAVTATSARFARGVKTYQSPQRIIKSRENTRGKT